MVFVGIIVSIFIFSVIVLFHEYGHYKIARIFKIQIDEFGLGIPPRAKKLWRNKSGTLFSLNWIPLGGFVKIAGESPEHPQAPKGQNFFEKNIFQKTGVLIAGVVMNFILAWGILSFLFLIGIKPIGINSVIPTELPSKIIPTFEQALDIGLIEKKEGIILYPVKDSIAEKAGILSGDMLLKVNGEDIADITLLQKKISENANISMTFSLERLCQDTQSCVNSGKIDITLTPAIDGKIGSYLSPNYEIQKDFSYQYGIFSSLKYGFLETYYQSRLTLSGLSLLIKNIFYPETPKDREEAIDQMAGPIGIVNVVTESLAGGISFLLILSALISINLGVFNLLPIPALDGGRIALLWIRTSLEMIFGKKKSIEKAENTLHIFFFLLLIALSVLIAYNDIIKIFFE